MLRVRWHRIVVIVFRSQPEIDLFEIGLADVDLVDRTNGRAILSDAEGFRIHLQPGHVGADEAPQCVEIATPRRGVDAFMNAPRRIDHFEGMVEARFQTADFHRDDLGIDGEFEKFSGILDRDFLLHINLRYFMPKQ